MSLKIILNNELLLDEIMKYLDQTSKISLSEVDRECNSIMRDCGYFENVLFRCSDGITDYLKSLELLENHKRTLKRITIERQLNIFDFLPKGIENEYEVVLKNCRVYVTKKEICERLKKVKLEGCLLKTDQLLYYAMDEKFNL
tara:strand:+ start:113 stop:541 length:429 start_codon:yes stop_codon:yes gene_type:complete